MNIYSIFKSISGEAGGPIKQGEWCVFIRLSSCNLRCKYCDTKYAQEPESGEVLSTFQVINKVEKYLPEIKKVLITGGEPLLQSEELIILCLSLRELGFSVSIETNGSIKPSPWLTSVVDWFVFDCKTPSSGMQGRMMDFGEIGYPCSVKFVCSHLKDLNYFYDFVEKYGKRKFEYWISPCMKTNREWYLSPNDIMEWLNKHELNFVGINTQLHKLLKLNEHM
jgi:7-carboxy-7-deazaguanine synthase